MAGSIDRSFRELARFEEILVRDGQLRWLVLRGDSALDAVDPALRENQPELAAWVGWRAERKPNSLWSLHVELMIDGQACVCALVCVEDHPQPDDFPGHTFAVKRQRMREAAAALGRPALIPVLERFLADPADGSVWLLGDATLTRVHDSIGELLARITRHYELRIARRALRYAALDEWRRLEAMPDRALPVGTALVFGTVDDGYRGAWLALALDDGPWAVHDLPAGAWRGTAAPTHAELEKWLERSREGNVEVMDSAAVQARLREAPGEPFVWQGLVDVWAQPSMEALLQRLQAVLRERHPELLASLNPSAGAAVGNALPLALRALYMVADGQNAGSPPLWSKYRWLPLGDAQAKRHELATLRDSEGPLAWQDSFVPLLAAEDGDVVYVDASGFHGPPGCIVSFDAKRPDGREILHENATQWLEGLVVSRERGESEPDAETLRALTYDVYPYWDWSFL